MTTRTYWTDQRGHRLTAKQAANARVGTRRRLVYEASGNVLGYARRKPESWRAISILGLRGVGEAPTLPKARLLLLREAQRQGYNV